MTVPRSPNHEQHHRPPPVENFPPKIGVCPTCGNLTFRGVPVKDMLSFPPGLAAKILGISYMTLRRQIQDGKIHVNQLNMISRTELERFANERLPTIPRRNRKPKFQEPPEVVSAPTPEPNYTAQE